MADLAGDNVRVCFVFRITWKQVTKVFINYLTMTYVCIGR